MPIYEYRCADCGHELEAIQKISEAPLQTCPQCGAESLNKMVSAPAFRLSGGGWYETDFKSEKETRRNLAGETLGSNGKSDQASKDGSKEGSKDAGGGKEAASKESSAQTAKSSSSATAQAS